jgi:hypothetical protein
MPTILLDDQVLDLAGDHQTWGELLAFLDGQLAPRDLIVTDVRLDGIDEPAFRDPQAVERPLGALATVEVASGTAASLMERCLAEAAGSVEPLCAAIAAVGEQFRGFDLAEANGGLIQIAESLSTLVGIVGAAGLALKVDLRQVMSEDRPVSSMVQEMSSFLGAMIEAQQAQDWITVADVLQYDVEPALRRWAPAFEAFATLPQPDQGQSVA